MIEVDYEAMYRAELLNLAADATFDPTATEELRPVELGFRLDTYAQPRIDVQLDARAAIRAGTELQALAAHTETARNARKGLLAAVKAANASNA